MILPARPNETKLKTVFDLVAALLGKDAVRLKPKSCVFEEDLEKGTSAVKCVFRHGRRKKELEATGSGPIDALYCGLVELYREEYSSLESVEFRGFAVEADFGNARGS